MPLDFADGPVARVSVAHQTPKFTILGLATFCCHSECCRPSGLELWSLILLRFDFVMNTVHGMESTHTQTVAVPSPECCSISFVWELIATDTIWSLCPLQD